MTSASKRAALRAELRVLYSQLKDLEKPRAFHLGKGDEYRSPYLTSFYDAFSTEDGYIHLAMEYMDGGSLQHRLDSPDVQASGMANPSVLRQVALGVTSGLAHLHSRSLIHRDIKPANVLLSAAGNVKVADFGVAKDLSSGKNLADTFVGTFLYMAPERIEGEEYGAPADVWGLGMTLLAQTLGRYARERASEASAKKECPAAADAGKR
jgi:serine/threonine protein kinase